MNKGLILELLFANNDACGLHVLAVNLGGGANVHRCFPGQLDRFNLCLPIATRIERVHVEGVTGGRPHIKAEGDQVAIGQQNLAGAVIADKLLLRAVERVGHIDATAIENREAGGGCVAGVAQYLLGLANLGRQGVHRMAIAFIESRVIRHGGKTSDAEQKNRGQSNAADGKDADGDDHLDQSPAGRFARAPFSKHSFGFHSERRTC